MLNFFKGMTLVWSWCSFAAITASTPLQMLSTGFWNAEGICVYSASGELVSSVTDVA